MDPAEQQKNEVRLVCPTFRFNLMSLKFSSCKFCCGHLFITKCTNYLSINSLPHFSWGLSQDTQGTPWTPRMAIYCRVQSHTHSQTTDSLEISISLKHASFVWEENLEYSEETLEEAGRCEQC